MRVSCIVEGVLVPCLELTCVVVSQSVSASLAFSRRRLATRAFPSGVRDQSPCEHARERQREERQQDEQDVLAGQSQRRGTRRRTASFEGGIGTRRNNAKLRGGAPPRRS